jgi:hypothetical protein
MAQKPLCTLEIGSYIHDKYCYLGEKVLEKFLLVHSEAFLEIKKA